MVPKFWIFALAPFWLSALLIVMQQPTSSTATINNVQHTK